MMRHLNWMAAAATLAVVISFAGLKSQAQAPEASITPFDLPFAIAIADLNGDGLPDLAVAESHISGPPPHPGFVSVILQNPQAPGSFSRAVHYKVGADPMGIAVGDLNGDGRPDLAVTSSSGGLWLLMQDQVTPGAFLPATRIQIGGYPEGVVIADIDGDGRPDVAVAAGAARIRIVYQDPSGPPGTFRSPVTVATKRGQWELAIGDLNGDGVPDLVGISSVVSVILQNPAQRGSFLPEKVYRAGMQADAVSIGDVNGDTLADIAVANYGNGRGGMGGVSVLLQDKAHPGTFARAVNYATGVGSTGVAIGDLDGDGRADIVTANNGYVGNSGSVSVLLQQAPRRGKLVFKRRNYPGKSGPWAVAIGDLNGDGKPDLAVADSSTATVLFQKPGSAGVFAAPVVVGR